MTLIQDIQEKQLLLAEYRRVTPLTGNKNPQPDPEVPLNTGLQGIIGVNNLPEPAQVSGPMVTPASQLPSTTTQYATPSAPLMPVLDPNFSGQSLQERTRFRLRQIDTPVRPGQNAVTQLTLDDFFRHLPNRSINSLQNPYEGQENNPLEGRFGDHGGGILGGLSWLLSLPQTVTSGIAADQGRSIGSRIAGNRAAERMLDRINSGRIEEDYANIRSLFNPFSWFQDENLSQQERDQIEMARARARAQFYDDTDNALGISYLGAGLLGMDLGATVLQEEDNFRPFAQLRQEDIDNTPLRTDPNPVIRNIVRGLFEQGGVSLNPEASRRAADATATYLSNSLDRPGLYGRVFGALVQDTILDPFGPLTDIAAAWRIGRTARNAANDVIAREAVRTIPVQPPSAPYAELLPSTSPIQRPGAVSLPEPPPGIFRQPAANPPDILLLPFPNRIDDPWLDGITVDVAEETGQLLLNPPPQPLGFLEAAPIAGLLPAEAQRRWELLMPDADIITQNSVRESIVRRERWMSPVVDPWLEPGPYRSIGRRLPQLPGDVPLGVPLLPGGYDGFVVPQEVADVVRLGDLYDQTFRQVLDDFTIRTNPYPEAQTTIFQTDTGTLSSDAGFIRFNGTPEYVDDVINVWENYLQNPRSRQYLYTGDALDPRTRAVADLLGFDNDSNRLMQVFDNRPSILREMYPMDGTSSRILFEDTMQDIQDGVISLEDLYTHFVRSNSVTEQGFYASLINQVARNSTDLPEPLLNVVRALDNTPNRVLPTPQSNRLRIQEGIRVTPLSDAPVVDRPDPVILTRMADNNLSPSTDILFSENGLAPEIIDAVPRTPRTIDEYDTIIVGATGLPEITEYRGREWLQLWGTLEAADRPTFQASIRGLVDPDRVGPARTVDLTDVTEARTRRIRPTDIERLSGGATGLEDTMELLVRYNKGEITTAEFLDILRRTDDPLITASRRARDAMSIAADLETVARNTDEIIQTRMRAPQPYRSTPDAPVLRGRREGIETTEVTTDPAAAVANAIARPNPRPLTTAEPSPPPSATRVRRSTTENPQRRGQPKPKEGGQPIVEEVKVAPSDMPALTQNEPLDIVGKDWSDQIYEMLDTQSDAIFSVLDEDRLIALLNNPMRTTGQRPSMRQFISRARAYLNRAFPNDTAVRTQLMDDLNERLMDVVSRRYSQVQKERSANVLQAGRVTVVGAPQPLPSDIRPEQIAVATAFANADTEMAEMTARQMQGQLRRMNSTNAQTARQRAAVEVENFSRELDRVEAAAEPTPIPRTTTPTADSYRPPLQEEYTQEYTTITTRLRERGRSSALVVESVEGHMLTGDWLAIQSSITAKLDNLMMRPTYTPSLQEYEQDLRRLYELATDRIREGYRATGELIDIPGLPC